MSLLESEASDTRVALSTPDIPPPPYQPQDPAPVAIPPAVQNESQASRASGDVLPPYQPPNPSAGIVPSSALIPAGRAQPIFYHVYASTFGGNYKVLKNDISQKFYVNSRRLRDPDLIVHEGTGDYDREVANCKYPQYGGLVEINLLRKVNDRSSMDRIQMTMDGRFTVKMSARDEAGATIHTEQHLAWRTPSMILIDESTGETAAIMKLEGWRGTKCFVLEIQEVQYGKQFELLVLCSAMMMYESRRRVKPITITTSVRA